MSRFLINDGLLSLSTWCRCNSIGMNKWIWDPSRHWGQTAEKVGSEAKDVSFFPASQLKIPLIMLGIIVYRKEILSPCTALLVKSCDKSRCCKLYLHQPNTEVLVRYNKSIKCVSPLSIDERVFSRTKWGTHETMV